MAVGDFILDFFFGPCLDNDAVDPRQNQPRRPQHQQQHPQSQPQREIPRSPSQRRERQSFDNGTSKYHSRSRGREDKRYPPTIPENEERRKFADDENGDGVGRNGNQHGRDRARNGSFTKGTRNGSFNNGTRGNSGTGQLRSKTHTRYTKSRSSRSSKSSHSHERSDANFTGVSSLSDSWGGKRRYRRDDSTVMSASLFDTYKGYLEDDPDELDEQSAIRRSLKDTKKSNKNNGAREGVPLGQHIVTHNGRNKPPTSDASMNSGKTDLESWIEKKGKSKSNGRKDDETDFDNVTTISKASKNPFRVLGLSQSASPEELYSTYQRKMKAVERSGGSDMAFTDVGNAYRRIRADIKRQEARKERRRLQGQGHGKKSKSRQSKRQESSSSDEDSDIKSRHESIDARLKDHRDLVQDLFAKDNSRKSSNRRSSSASVSSRGQVTTLENSVQSQSQALSELNLVPVEAGAANINEQNQTIQNSCFYLSLAASYLSGVGAFTEDPTASYYLNTLSSGQSVATVEMEIATLAQKEKQLTMNLALQLKRAIEAAVLLVHPDWAKSGMVGEEVQAFSDFLVYALDSDSVLGHWAIAVFDEASGFVDIYRGRHYGKIYPPTKVKIRKSGGRSKTQWKYKDCDAVTKRANTLTLRYIPGHYQPLLPELTKLAEEQKKQKRALGLQKRPALEDTLSTLEKWNVLHVVTDGRA